MQAAFNFMSCGAVAMAKTYAGSDAMLTMGLIMAAHLVSLLLSIVLLEALHLLSFLPLCVKPVS